LLSKAREIEFESISSIDELTESLQIKQFALVLRDRGDLEGAKLALIKLKQLEQRRNKSNVHIQKQEQEQGKCQYQNQKQQNKKEATSGVSFSETGDSNTSSQSSQEKHHEGTCQNNEEIFIRIVDDEDRDQKYTNNVDGIIIVDDENHQSNTDDDGANSSVLNDFDTDEIIFTEDEMLDEEMMTEFKVGGMHVPSSTVYQAKVLLYKKSALSFKNKGDIPRATADLRRAKQFEAIGTALSHMNEGVGLRINDDDFGWIEELNQEDSDILGEFLNNKSVLEMEDLDDMDVHVLKDAIEVGLVIPSVEDVLRQSNEQKRLALALKSKGNIEDAKAALIKSKRLCSHANKLDQMLKEIEMLNSGDSTNEIENGSNETDILLSLVEKNDTNGLNPSVKPLADQKPFKTANEYKQEIIRFRDENNMTEATKMMKLFKNALKEEAQVKEANLCSEIVQQIDDEIQVAEKQKRLYTFVGRFVDAEMGTEQQLYWSKYASSCAKVKEIVKSKGARVLEISRSAGKGGLMHVQNNGNLLDFVECGAVSSDMRLEFAILDVRNLHQNKNWQKLFDVDPSAAKIENNVKNSNYTIRANVTVQLPPSMADVESCIELSFEALPTEKRELNDEELAFPSNESQYVDLPRGDSKYAKLILKRMERRRIQINLYHIPVEEKAKGWIGSFSKTSVPSDRGKSPTHLGKVVLDLKKLLSKNSIAGDFPLMTSNTRVAGGIVGLSVRTGAPFDPSRKESVTFDTIPFEKMSFSAPPEAGEAVK